MQQIGGGVSEEDRSHRLRLGLGLGLGIELGLGLWFWLGLGLGLVHRRDVREVERDPWNEVGP